MAVVVSRASLSAADKEFIKTELLITSKDEETTLKPFKVIKNPYSEDPNNGTVHLPFAFYRELREHGKHDDWLEFPNDARHSERFNPEWQFTGTLRDYQVEVWKELLSILRQRRSLLLGAYCGFGKTMMTVYIAAKAQLTTLIVYHISPLARSWPSSFEGASNAVVCHLNDGYDPNAHVYICSVALAGSDNFPFDPARVGMLVIDESHCYATAIRINMMLRFTPRYLLCLTATPERADGLGCVLGLFHGRLKSGDDGKPLSDQVPCEVVRANPRTFTVYRQKTGLKPKITSNARGLDWQEVKKSLLTRPELVTAIADWCLLNPHKKILVYVVQIDQLQAVIAELNARGEQDVQGFYGNMSTHRDVRVLVGIDKKISLAYDEASVATDFGGRRYDTMVLGWTIKDPSSLDQTIGRLRVDGGTIVDFVHAFSSFEKHWKARLQYYTFRKATVVEVTGPIRVP
jgi:Type III restriction enzyme, res subunit